MEWFVFAFIAMMLFPLCNVISKFILTNKTKDVLSYNLMTYVFDVFTIILLASFLNLKFDFSVVLSVLYGFIFVFIWILYFKAIKEEEISRVAMTRSSAPIFVLILSYVFLKETLDFNKYLGIILLVSSAFLASYKKSGNKFHITKALATIILFVFGTACMSVLTKYTLNFTDYWNFFFWSIVGGQIGCLLLLLLPSIRKNFVREAIKIGKKTWLAILVSYIISLVGWISYYVAVSMGKISIVYALMSTRPMILFIYTLILTFFMPHILKEDVNRISLLMKSLAGILIIIGSYLIVT